MKINQYNQMMSYLSDSFNPALLRSQVATLEQREGFATGGTYKDYVSRGEEYKDLTFEEWLQEDKPGYKPSEFGRVDKAIGGGVIEGKNLGTREGYAKISKIDRRTKKNSTRADKLSDEKQKVVDDVLEGLIKEGKTTFEKVKEVTEKITAKGTMSSTTARTGIENSKFLSQFEFLGPGAGLDKEILESDWFKRNYPNATTIEEASGDQALAKVRNQYKLAKERGFPLSQKEFANEIGIPRQTLRDYISYSRTSKKPQNPTDISRVKRAKEFVNLLKEAGITFSGGGTRYGASDIRFIANPEQLKK
mgnify:FL=1